MACIHNNSGYFRGANGGLILKINTTIRPSITGVGTCWIGNDYSSRTLTERRHRRHQNAASDTPRPRYPSPTIPLAHDTPRQRYPSPTIPLASDTHRLRYPSPAIPLASDTTRPTLPRTRISGLPILTTNFINLKYSDTDTLI